MRSYRHLTLRIAHRLDMKKNKKDKKWAHDVTSVFLFDPMVSPAAIHSKMASC